MQAHVAGRLSRHLDLYEDCARVVPGLVMCAHSHSLHAVGEDLWAGLEPHRHDGWEIHWIAAGAVEWWTGSAPAADIGAHWCHVIPPGVRHGSTTGMLEPCEVWWLQLRPAQLGWIPARHRKQIEDGLRALPSAFLAGDLLPDWQGLCTAVALAAGHPPGSLHAFHATACLSRLLARILLEEKGRRGLSPALDRILAQAEHPQSGVGDLARSLGCSPTALHRLFRHELGISPAAWLRRQRINQAKRLLRTTGDDITAIAGRLRFASSQQFATQFRQLAGITPSEYRLRSQAVAR